MSNGGTIEEVDAEITILRDAKRAHEACSTHAETLISDALRAQTLARDAELYARQELDQQQQIVADYTGEIDLLLEERGALIPVQAEPVD